jgi:methionyl-tRNA formyltransferase
MSLRIVFMGTAGFAVPTLVEIVGQGHDVAAVYTRPPRAAGRGLGERRSAVHDAAERLGLPVLTPRTLRDPATLAEFAAHDADVAVVVAYGLILPPPALATPREGCLNLHASLLPRWRGAAPVARAIMAGDAETGVAVMQMEAGLDTGPVAMVERVPIPIDATAGAMTEQLARLGADLMVRALAGLSRGGLDFVPQPEEGVTYAAKIEKAETRIDWGRPGRAVHDHIRGLSPSPGAWTEVVIAGRAERVKVLRSQPAEGAGAPGAVLDDALRVACGEGAVRLVELQRAGGRPMPADAFLRGAAVPPGTLLA